MENKLRVLCIDGGGMRGVYTARYLDELQKQFLTDRNESAGGLDIGKGFDLIVGTSTGGIIGLGLAYGVSPAKMLDLYKRVGPEIFRAKLPSTLGAAVRQYFSRPSSLESGDKALTDALSDIFESKTIGDLFCSRGIAVAVPAVDMQSRRAWVFKSNHLPNSRGRDDGYRLVDVCKATSAAPLYRSLAAIKNVGSSGHRVFADGGLCANSPVMVGLLDALAMAKDTQEIEIFHLGTCKPPSGTVIPVDKIHWGLKDWKFGGVAAEVAVDAQEQMSSDIARLIRPYLKKDVSFVEFPRQVTIANLDKHLGLDETRLGSLEMMESQADADVNETLSLCADETNESGRRIKQLFESIPLLDG